MIVVSDTSPLTALLTINATDLLFRLFGEVVIPIAVRDELLRSHPHLPLFVLYGGGLYWAKRKDPLA